MIITTVAATELLRRASLPGEAPFAVTRNFIGVVIFSGSIFAILLALFVVPVFHDLLARFTKSPDWMAKQIESYTADGGHTAPAE